MAALLRSREAECTRIAGQRRGAVTFRLAAEKQRHAALPYYRDCNLEFKRLEDLSEGQHREGHSGRWFCWFAATRLHSLAWGRMREQSVTPSRRGRRPKNFERARWSNKTKHYSGVLIVCFCFCTDGIHFAHYL